MMYEYKEQVWDWTKRMGCGGEPPPPKKKKKKKKKGGGRIVRAIYKKAT